MGRCDLSDCLRCYLFSKYSAACRPESQAWHAALLYSFTCQRYICLDFPWTAGDFLSVCETLKSKDYIPIQSSQYHAYSDMALPMAMSILGNAKELTAKIDEGDSSYADSLLPVYQHLKEIIDLGYTSLELNQTYPDGNYEEAILKFFEGDVPFWIANTESVSGMKKWENKEHSLDIIRNENIIYLDNNLRSDGIVWNWRRL